MSSVATAYGGLVTSSCIWPGSTTPLQHTCGRSVNLSCLAQSLSTVGSLVVTGVVLGVRCEVGLEWKYHN